MQKLAVDRRNVEKLDQYNSSILKFFGYVYFIPGNSNTLLIVESQCTNIIKRKIKNKILLSHLSKFLRFEECLQKKPPTADENKKSNLIDCTNQSEGRLCLRIFFRTFECKNFLLASHLNLSIEKEGSDTLYASFKVHTRVRFTYTSPSPCSNQLIKRRNSGCKFLHYIIYTHDITILERSYL